MWDWLKRAFDWATGAVGGTVTPFVHDIIHGVWAWLTSMFQNVGNAWHFMYTAGGWVQIAFEHFGLNSLAAVWDIIFKRLPALVSWVWNHLQRLWHFATQIFNDLKRDVINLIIRIATAVHNALQWVHDHVLVPLVNRILEIWKWIDTFGKVVWFYISHPAKLAALIFDELIALLEREAWNVGAKLGKFFLALVVHNLRQFVSLIEDILMAVF